MTESGHIQSPGNRNKKSLTMDVWRAMTLLGMLALSWLLVILLIYGAKGCGIRFSDNFVVRPMNLVLRTFFP